MGKHAINAFRTHLLSLKRVGIDSMCFLYHFADDKTYAPLTQTLFTLLETKKIQAVTSAVTVAEIFVRAEIAADHLLLSDYETALTTLPNMEIVSIDWHVARLAAKLRAAYPTVKTPDMLQVAVTLLKGYKGFVTNDIKLKQIKELDVVLLQTYR